MRSVLGEAEEVRENTMERILPSVRAVCLESRELLSLFERDEVSEERLSRDRFVPIYESFSWLESVQPY
jgi:hypothetical protein